MSEKGLLAMEKVMGKGVQSLTAKQVKDLAEQLQIKPSGPPVVPERRGSVSTLSRPKQPNGPPNVKVARPHKL